MRRRLSAPLAWIAILLLPVFASAQTTIVGDAWIKGRMAVGTSSATARLEVQESNSALAAFQVSGVDETPFWVVNSTGSVGAGISPLSRLDINGSADSSAIGLMLRDGSMSYPNTSSYQMTFGYNSSGLSTMRHAIATSHSTSAIDGSMDFYIWNSAAGGQSNIGSLDALEVVVISTDTGNMGSMRIDPVASPTFPVQVEVSDGNVPGGGTVERLSEQTPSSRDRKMNIAYLDQTAEARAYEDVRSLKLAEFRYKSYDKKKKALERDKKQPLRRGLIYEDSPESIRGPGQSIVFDARVANLEMATKEFLRRLDELKAEADKAGGSR